MFPTTVMLRTFPLTETKGGCGSAEDLDGKAGLKVHLSWDDAQVAGCPAKRRLGGLEKLTFNNMTQDPSMSHEMLAYALYAEMGVPVPRATYARVTVNGEYFGIYAHLETIDRRFLARHFGSNRGALYEGTYWCDLIASNVRDDDTGYGFDGLGRNTGAAVDPSGNVWLANNWLQVPFQTNPGGHEIVAFVGLAAPQTTPVIGPPER